MTEDEMVGWHHRLNGHRFGWTLGVGEGQGGRACCGSWGPHEVSLKTDLSSLMGFPGGSDGKESACRRVRFDL